MNDKLIEERDQLQITVDDLREKLNEAMETQQEIEVQRDTASENISQVKWHVLKDTRLMGTFI